MVAELATTLTPASDEDRLLQAEALVRAYCGWHIAPVRTHTVVVSSFDATLVLPTLRLVEVVSVVASDGTVLDPIDYRADPAGVITRNGAHVTPWGYHFGWGHAWGDLTVTYRHGYDTPPADVTAVVQGLASRAKAGTTGLASRTMGPFSESYGADLFGTDREVLARYRLPARA
jgi:hypothetical protein